MPAWIYAVLALILAGSIMRWVIVRYQRNVNRIVKASRNGATPLPAPVTRRPKIYDR